MAGEKTIATLVGKLRFEADNRPLKTFEANLDRVFKKVDSLSQLAGKKIMLKVGLDTKSLADNLQVARNAKLVLKNVGVSNEALTATVNKISEKLSTARIKIEDVKIPIASLNAQKKLMRSLLESTTIDLPVDVKLKKADAALRAWKKRTEEKFKLYLSADISKHKFYQNVKASVEYVTGKIGTMRFEPKIQLKVDRAALRTEINTVLKEIERQAKIKIQLTGNLGGGGGGEGGAGGRVGMRQHALTGGVAGAAASWGRGFVPGLGGAFAVSQLNRINQELQAQQLAMTAVMGSPEAGKEQQAWFSNLAQQLGLHERATMPSYTKMLASGLTSGFQTEEVQNIFTGISSYGRTMGLDSEAMKGTMRAVEQMMNKGQIMSEELKGQLAERAPGVISAMAEAAGFGTDSDAAAKLFKAMENGEVKSKDVLEKFSAILLERAKQGGALEKAMKSTAAEQQRFNTAFDKTVVAFSEGGFDKAIARFFREMTENMMKSTGAAKGLGEAFNILMQPVYAVIRLFGDLGKATGIVAERLGVSQGKIMAFGAAALFNLTPLGRMVTLISSLALAVEDFVTYLEGGESKFGKWFESLSPDKQERLEAFGSAMAKLAENVFKLADLSLEGLKGLIDLMDSSGFGWDAVDRITKLAEAFNKLADAIFKLRNGDASGMKDIASPNNMLETLGTVNPLAGAINFFKDDFAERLNKPTTPEAIAQDKALAGKSMIPMTNQQTIQRVEISVDGSKSPEETAGVIKKALDDLMQKTKTNLVEVRK
jgi:tape measure domain-containing protein